VITPADREPPLAGPRRVWARGIYPDEAAVELLISHATFLRRADFTSRFISTSASGDGTGLAAIDWTAAITALDADLPCSAVLSSACSGCQPAWATACPSTSATLAAPLVEISARRFLLGRARTYGERPPLPVFLA
jgi:hypothetical protein